MEISMLAIAIIFTSAIMAFGFIMGDTQYILFGGLALVTFSLLLVVSRLDELIEVAKEN